MFLGQATPTPGVGVEEVVDLWPAIRRAMWFLGGFLAVAIIGLLIVVPLISRAVRHRNPRNSTLTDAVTRYLRLLVLVIGVLLGAVVAGYGRVIGDSALVVAAATLALGVAGQTVIGSLVSGMVLVFDPEFNVGDYIQWDDGEGSVQTITFRVTRVITPQGELVTVPNTILTEQAIRRPFGRRRYRVLSHVELSYEDDIDAGLREIEAAIDDVSDIAEAPTPDVFVEELGDDGIVVAAQFWIADPEIGDVPEVHSAFTKAVKARLEAADIEISPAPERDLGGRLQVDRTDEQ